MSENIPENTRSLIRKRSACTFDDKSVVALHCIEHVNRRNKKTCEELLAYRDKMRQKIKTNLFLLSNKKKESIMELKRIDLINQKEYDELIRQEQASYELSKDGMRISSEYARILKNDLNNLKQSLDIVKTSFESSFTDFIHEFNDRRELCHLILQNMKPKEQDNNDELLTQGTDEKNEKSKIGMFDLSISSPQIDESIAPETHCSLKNKTNPNISNCCSYKQHLNSLRYVVLIILSMIVLML